MDALNDLVRQRRWDQVLISTADWAETQMELTKEQRQRRIALELFKAWKRTSKNDKLVETVVVENSLKEECHVIFVKTLRFKAVSIAVKNCDIGKEEASYKSIVIFYEKWSSKLAWKKIKQIREGRQTISIFNSSLLTMPLTRYINKTVSESRGVPTTYWSLVKPQRMRRGYSRLQSKDKRTKLSTVLRDCGQSDEDISIVIRHYYDDLNLELDSKELDDTVIEMSDNKISKLLEIFQELECDSVTVTSDFNRAIMAINNRKRYKGDLEELLRKLPCMSVFDPANLYVGARVGDIVYISRDDAIPKTGKSTPMYRLVTDIDDLIPEGSDEPDMLDIEEEKEEEKEEGDDNIEGDE